jgi:hypothetical protein
MYKISFWDWNTSFAEFLPLFAEVMKGIQQTQLNLKAWHCMKIYESNTIFPITINMLIYVINTTIIVKYWLRTQQSSAL